jgi:hypothetical protein
VRASRARPRASNLLAHAPRQRPAGAAARCARSPPPPRGPGVDGPHRAARRAARPPRWLLAAAAACPAPHPIGVGRVGVACAQSGGCRGSAQRRARARPPQPQQRRDPPPPRTKWTRRVPHPVRIGHAASLSQVGGGGDPRRRPARRRARVRAPAARRAAREPLLSGGRRDAAAAPPPRGSARPRGSAPRASRARGAAAGEGCARRARRQNLNVVEGGEAPLSDRRAEEARALHMRAPGQPAGDGPGAEHAPAPAPKRGRRPRAGERCRAAAEQHPVAQPRLMQPQPALEDAALHRVHLRRGCGRFRPSAQVHPPRRCLTTPRQGNNLQDE